MRRPALLSLSLYALGISLARILSVPVFYPSVLLVFLFLGLLVLNLLSKEEHAAYLLATALLLTGSLSYSLSARWHPPHHIGNYLGRDLLLGGRVADEPELQSGSVTFRCRCQTLPSEGEGARTAGNVLVKWKEPAEELRYGDAIEMRGRLEPAHSFRNPRGFDYRDYLSQRGVFGIFRVQGQDLKVVARDSGNPFLAGVIFPAKRYLRRNIDRNLGGDPGALLKGILLGERKAISESVQQVFANAGVIHVLAVSGLHVGIVFSILFLLFRLLRVPFRLTLICVTVFLPFYALITGLRPSVTRATVMALCLLVGWMLERGTDPLNILGFAGLIILLAGPQSVFDVGFQLSFVATFSILYLYPRLDAFFSRFTAKGRRFWFRWLAAPFAVSVSAQVGVVPLVAHHFFTLPLLPAFANLIIVPLIGAALALGFASSLAGLVSQGLAGAFAASNWLVLSCTLRVVGFLGSLPFASLRVARPSPALIALYYLVLVGLANWKSSPLARRGVIFSVLVALNLLVWPLAMSRNDLQVTFLDVGRGESCLVRFPNNRTLLIDGGAIGPGFDAGEDLVAPFLWSHGIRRIDLMVLSNPHNEHLGGLPYILENFQVGLVAEAGFPHSSRSYKRFLSLVAEKSVPYRVVRRGDVINELGVPIYVLHPGEGLLKPGSDLREQSVVLQFTYGEVTFLFPGDYLDPEGYDHVDVLKVPCLGISGSALGDRGSGPPPKTAVCSSTGGGVGLRELLRFYEARGATVHCTQEDGAIVLRTNGEDISIQTVAKSKE